MDNGGTWVVSFLWSAFQTAALYGAGPILFARCRKRPIKERHVRAFSIAYSVLAWIAVAVSIFFLEPEPTAPSGGAALFWGAIFYRMLKRDLDRTGRLIRKDGSCGRPVEQEGSKRPAAEPAGRAFPIESDGPECSAAESGGTEEGWKMAESWKTEESPRTPEIGGTAGTFAPRAAERRSWTGTEAFGPEIPEKRLPIGTIALVLVCAALAVCTGVLGYRVHMDQAAIETLTAEQERLESDLADLKTRKDDVDKKYIVAVRERNDLQDQLDVAHDLGLEMYSELYGIGYVVEGSPYYHHFRCDELAWADTYWAHNVEYCEYLGYPPCPDCW